MNVALEALARAVPKEAHAVAAKPRPSSDAEPPEGPSFSEALVESAAPIEAPADPPPVDAKPSDASVSISAEDQGDVATVGPRPGDAQPAQQVVEAPAAFVEPEDLQPPAPVEVAEAAPEPAPNAGTVEVVAVMPEPVAPETGAADGEPSAEPIQVVSQGDAARGTAQSPPPDGAPDDGRAAVSVNRESAPAETARSPVSTEPVAARPPESATEPARPVVAPEAARTAEAAETTAAPEPGNTGQVEPVTSDRSAEASAPTAAREPDVETETGSPRNGGHAPPDPDGPSAGTPEPSGIQAAAGPEADQAFEIAAAGEAEPTDDGGQAAQVSAGRLVRAVRLTVRNDGGHARIQLDPPSLGRVDIDVVVRGGVVSASLQTHSREAGEMVTSQLPMLRGALERHGLAIEQIDVTVDDEAGADPAGGSFADRQGAGADDNAFGWAPWRSRAGLATAEPPPEPALSTDVEAGRAPRTALDLVA